MNLLQSLILGVVQGLTEFLPISSSAHLVLVPFLFRWNIPEEQIFPFDVLVQVGTLMAVIIYFWKDLVEVARAFLSGIVRREPFEEVSSRLGWYILLATLPAGVIGLLMDDLVEAAFNSPISTALFLFGTALIMLFAEWRGHPTRPLVELNWKDALLIGLAQALAVFPGISRSGATISAGILLGMKRDDAGRFSFLMAVPITLAAGLLSLVQLREIPNLADFLPVLLVGFLTAGFVGYLSIHWLLSFLNRNSLRPFSVYCFLAGSLTLILAALR
jgi:undecaprenyl-diphosphatase